MRETLVVRATPRRVFGPRGVSVGGKCGVVLNGPPRRRVLNIIYYKCGARARVIIINERFLFIFFFAPYIDRVYDGDSIYYYVYDPA